MRTKHLLTKMMLLVAVMLTGAGTAWAEDPTSVTINFGTTTGYWSAHTNENYTDSDSRMWSRTCSVSNMSGQAAYSQFGNASNACKSLELTATAGSDITVTAFSVTMAGASGGTSPTTGTIYLYKKSGDTETQLATASVSGTTSVTCSITSSQAFSSTDILKVSYVGTAKAIRVSELKYSYITGGGDTPSTYTITPQSNNPIYGTVSLSGSTITATPAEGYRVSLTNPFEVTIGTATVTQNGNSFSVAAESDCTVLINFEAIPTHTVTFSVNGTTTTQDFKEDAAITFPTNPGEINGNVFMGWVTQAISGTQTVAPEFVTSATMGESDITYYAVFAVGDEAYSDTETEISQTLAYDTWTYYGDTFDKSTYRVFCKDSYIESAAFDLSLLKQVNVYGGGSFGTIPSGQTRHFTIKGGNTTWAEQETSGTSQTNKLTVTSKVALSGNGKVQVISDCGTAGSSGLRISKVEILIKKKVTTYTDYCTTVTGLPKPVITLSTESIEMFWGDNDKTLTASATMNGAAFQGTITLTPSSADLTIDSEGKISCDVPGNYTITASIAATDTYQAANDKVCAVTVNKKDVTLSFPEAAYSTDINDEFTAPTLTNETGVAVTYSSTNENVAEVASDGTLTIKAEGETTIKASFAGNTLYNATADATYTLTVTDRTRPGSQTNPYTVAQARAAIDANSGLTNVYAKGIVSQAGNLSSGAISYYISDDGTKTNELQAYKGKNYNGASFTSANDIKVGDVVVIYGTLKKYNSIYEFDSGNQLVSLKRLSVDPATADPFTYEQGGDLCDEQEFTVTGLNLTGDITVSVTGEFNLRGPSSGYGNSSLTLSNGDSFGLNINDNLTEGNYEGTLTIASEGATTITIALMGTVTGYIAPSITATETTVNVSAAESNGTIEMAYTKIDLTNTPEVRYFESDGTTSVSSYDWITAGINATDNTKLDYVISANEGEARTAYMKVYALDNNGQDTWSKLITITQAAYVAPTTYSLTTSITSGKHYVIGNGTNMVMGEQRDNNRGAVEVEYGTTENTLRIASESKATEFVIYGPDVNGFYTIYDAAKGYLYAASSSSNHLKSETALDDNNNGKWSISINAESGEATVVAQGDKSNKYMRFNSTLFSCYSSTSSVKDLVYFYEKDGEATPTETIHVTDAKYATFYSENPLDFEGTGLTAYVADQKGTSVTFEPVTKVPAYTGVLVKANAAGDYTVPATSSFDGAKGSDLKGVLVETKITGAGIFVLMNGDEGVGFYKTTSAEFTVGAHTAYLPKTTGLSRTFINLDEATGIEAIVAEKASNGEVYNLQGQRVMKAQKGLYIMNGKKVLVK